MPGGSEDVLLAREVLVTTNMKLHDRVLMFAQVSGKSFGVFSYADPKVRLPGQPSPTAEAVIVGLKGRHFAQKGDSGAFVINEKN